MRSGICVPCSMLKAVSWCRGRATCEWLAIWISRSDAWLSWPYCLRDHSRTFRVPSSPPSLIPAHYGAPRDAAPPSAPNPISLPSPLLLAFSPISRRATIQSISCSSLPPELSLCVSARRPVLVLVSLMKADGCVPPQPTGASYAAYSGFSTADTAPWAICISCYYAST
jgi:hypothetical protein